MWIISNAHFTLMLSIVILLVVDIRYKFDCALGPKYYTKVMILGILTLMSILYSIGAMLYEIVDINPIFKIISIINWIFAIIAILSYFNSKRSMAIIPIYTNVRDLINMPYTFIFMAISIITNFIIII